MPSSLAGQQLIECKRRVAAFAREIPNTIVLDFMIDSALTREDRNYWDSLHYTQAIADELVRHIKHRVQDHHGRATTSIACDAIEDHAVLRFIVVCTDTCDKKSPA
jgi:hypothetical protein